MTVFKGNAFGFVPSGDNSDKAVAGVFRFTYGAVVKGNVSDCSAGYGIEKSQVCGFTVVRILNVGACDGTYFEIV